MRDRYRSRHRTSESNDSSYDDCRFSRRGSRHLDRHNRRDLHRRDVSFMSAENLRDQCELEVNADYGPDGYLDCKLGDVIGKRYLLLKKLGSGHFSTVWLCYDRLHLLFRAMKICKSNKLYLRVADDEWKIMCDIRASREKLRIRSSGVIEGLEFVNIRTDSGLHKGIIFNFVGPTLLTLLRHYKYTGVPLDVVRAISYQITKGLLYLHESCGIFHTDLKPENILVHCDVRCLLDKPLRKTMRSMLESRSCFCLCHANYCAPVRDNPEEMAHSCIQRYLYARSRSDLSKHCNSCKNKEAKCEITNLFNEIYIHGSHKIPIDTNLLVKIADLGNSRRIDNREHTALVQTRQYRAPEVITKIGYGPSIDIWSLGCIVYELLTGIYLFNPKSTPSYSKDEHAVSPDYFPSIYTHRDRSGRFRARVKSLKTNIMRGSIYRHMVHELRIDKYTSKETSDFITPLLDIVPNNRLVHLR